MRRAEHREGERVIDVAASPQSLPEALLREPPDVESSTEDYAGRFAGEVGGFFLDRQWEVILDLLAPWPGARVLEVGGGHAQITPPLVERGFQVTVAGSTEDCRRRLDGALPAGAFEFRACDLLNLPFPDRSFDVVICLRLLGHLDSWRQLVTELCRVADRGLLADYSDLRSFNRFYGLLFPWKKAIEGNTRSYRIFQVGEIAAEGARHGFGKPEERRQFFLPMVAHRALGRARFSRTVERASARLGLTRRYGSPVVLRLVREEIAE